MVLERQNILFHFLQRAAYAFGICSSNYYFFISFTLTAFLDFYEISFHSKSSLLPKCISLEKGKYNVYCSLTFSSQEEKGLVLFHGDSYELISISSQDYDMDLNSVQTKIPNWSAGETCSFTGAGSGQLWEMGSNV